MPFIRLLLERFNVLGYQLLSELGGSHEVVRFVLGPHHRCPVLDTVVSLEDVVGDGGFGALLERLDHTERPFHLILLILFINHHNYPIVNNIRSFLAGSRFVFLFGKSVILFIFQFFHLFLLHFFWLYRVTARGVHLVLHKQCAIHTLIRWYLLLTR